MQPYCSKSATRCVIDWGFEMTEHPLPSGDGPYADHPVLAPLSRAVRQSIADQIAHNRNIGAIKTLRDALGGSNIGLKEAKDVIDGLVELGDPTRPGSSSAPVKVVSGKIDKVGTTLTLYRDGTFTTTGMMFTSNPDRLVGFSADTDSMRRKSVTGRGAAFIATGGLSVLASNNRGVLYVTVTGELSGSKTYTSKNPENKLLSSVRSLQATADQLLASPHPPTIQVLERMFSLLDMLASQTEPATLKSISQATGLHPSTAHRILNDLAVGRFVDRPQAGSYRLGMRLLELGNLVKARLDVREAALGPMRELHKLTHQTVNLSVRQGDEIVYIERTYSERSGMQVVRAIGGRAPLHLTSVGKLFLAAEDPQRVRAYATRTGLTGHTRNSITDAPRLERELSTVRALGTARDDEELELGVRCMAAGIHDDQGKLVAGLSVSAPADRLEEGWLERVRATAAEISAALGYRPGSTR